MAQAKSRNEGDRDGQFWDAIALFEGILESMPEDRVALEALALAYEQIGDLARARDYLVRLAKVVLREEDREGAELAREHLSRYPSEPSAAETVQILDVFLSRPVSDRAASIASGGASVVSRRQDVLRREMDFAWELLQENDLSQDEYAAIIQDLSELLASERVRTISVLHAVQDRNWPNLDRILVNSAKRGDLPLLPLSAFDPQYDAFQRMPLDLMIQRGALPFEQLGTDLLVALLNPSNRELRQEVEGQTGRHCHFYLTPPADFDAAIEVIRTRLAALDDEHPTPRA